VLLLAVQNGKAYILLPLRLLLVQDRELAVELDSLQVNILLLLLLFLDLLLN